MKDTAQPTEFAPPGRAEKEKLDREVQLVSEIPFLRKHFDSIPSTVLVLNEHRQIVFANKATVTAFDLEDRTALYGLRPGEALNCVHADKSEHGCGTTSFCRECGAVRAILSGLGGSEAVEECRITPKKGNPFDLRVATSPYDSSAGRFTVFVVNDISHEKRRQVLERTFFHDISNTLTIVSGCLDLMVLDLALQENDRAMKTSQGVKMLVSEIEAQRGLLRAEDGELPLKPAPMSSVELLNDVVSVYQQHELAEEKTIQVDERAVDVEFTSDKTLLSRIIANMLKNALEASSAGESVCAGCEPVEDGRICLWVKNEQAIPEEAQLQIFNRSFSTKGKGRGIGTYSMKLLAERYLKGEVSFTSSPEDGTVFKVTLPLVI